MIQAFEQLVPGQTLETHEQPVAASSGSSPRAVGTKVKKNEVANKLMP